MKGFLTGPIGIVVMVTIGVGMLAAIEGLHYVRSAAHFGRVVGVFALLGLFLGVIYATDPRDGFAVRDRPIARAVLSFAIELLARCRIQLGHILGTSVRRNLWRARVVRNAMGEVCRLLTPA